MTWFMIILVIMCMWLYAHNVFSLTYSYTVSVCVWHVLQLICMRVWSVLMYTYRCHNMCIVIWVHKNECMLWQSAATSFIYSLSFYDSDRNLTRHFASWHVMLICIHTVLIISLQCILLSEITNLNIICWNVSSTSMYIYEFYFVIVEFFR